MEFPDDVKYTKDHEWIKIEDNIATIGITDYAQEKLGDIVYVELPDVGEVLEKGDAFGSVESVKSVSDCYTPVAGEVIEVNDLLVESPEAINEDPYGEGWMVKIKLQKNQQLDDLMTNIEYENYVSEESEE
jgi:glycine cleavage system H protein